MFTNVLPRLHVTISAPEPGPFLKETYRHTRRALCGLRGHDLVTHIERGRRVCLRCLKCGYETPGWSTR